MDFKKCSAGHLNMQTCKLNLVGLKTDISSRDQTLSIIIIIIIIMFNAFLFSLMKIVGGS